MSIHTAPHDVHVDQWRDSPVDTRGSRHRSPSTPSAPPTSTRPRLAPFFTVALLWLSAGIVAWLALRTVTGQQLDEWALEDAQALGSSGITTLLSTGLEAVPLLGVIGCALAALIAGFRTRRVSSAVIILVTAVLSVVSVQVLKLAVLDKPDLGIQAIASNSFPSGHASVASIVSCLLVVAVPAAMRGWTAIAGAAATALVGAATVLTSWHRPADVVAAILVSAGWSVIAAALLPSGTAFRGVATHASSLSRIAGMVLGGLALALAAALGIAQVWVQVSWLALGAGLMAIAAFALLALTVVALQPNRRASPR